ESAQPANVRTCEFANGPATPTHPHTHTPTHLSLCMIARDEEPRIEECLRSIAPYVDEMVVVDTGSKDRTREIARDCGARVFEMAWPDSFAEARNASLDLARGQWIFWMDADDVISPECGEQLRALVQPPRANLQAQAPDAQRRFPS